MENQKLLENVVALSKRRGIIYQNSEIEKEDSDLPLIINLTYTDSLKPTNTQTLNIHI